MLNITREENGFIVSIEKNETANDWDMRMSRYVFTDVSEVVDFVTKELKKEKTNG